MGHTLLLLHLAKGPGLLATASVRSHHPLVIPGNHLLDLLVAVPGAHLVDRGLVGVEGHQVGVLPTHFPAGVVGVDYPRVPYPIPQCLVHLAYPAPGPAQRIPSAMLIPIRYDVIIYGK